VHDLIVTQDFHYRRWKEAADAYAQDEQPTHTQPHLWEAQTKHAELSPGRPRRVHHEES
jgi:hypothetical protein